MKSSSTFSLPSYGGHSAVVNMRLVVNGLALRVAQLGPDFVLVDEPVDHPPAMATLHLQVDKSERSWPVNLAKGISAESKFVHLGVLQQATAGSSRPSLQ